MLREKYCVLADIASGSWATTPDKSLDLDLCAIVRQEVLDRAHVRVLDIAVDLSVCGEKRTRKQLQWGVQAHLSLFATGRHVFGD